VDRPAGRARRINRLVSPRRGRDYLRRLGFTRQVPRPRHAEGDFAAQERFKAGFRARVQELTRANPDRSVQVWAFDEHRAGLKPVIRRIWARRGQRPLAVGHHGFAWLYVHGFVRPATGEVVWFLADAANTAMSSEILAAFARAVGAGPDDLVVLVLDGAGCMSPKIWSSRTASNWSSCLPTHPNSSRPSISGRLCAKRSPTNTSKPGTISTAS
jgi:Winged helix-turn helix